MYYIPTSNGHRRHTPEAFQLSNLILLRFVYKYIIVKLIM